MHGERGHSVASRMVSMRKNFSGTSLSSTKHSGKNSDVESGQRGSFVAGHLASAMMTHAASVASAAGLDSESVCTFTVYVEICKNQFHGKSDMLNYFSNFHIVLDIFPSNRN